MPKQKPRDLAVLGLQAMARYRASGLCDGVREKLHETIAARLARVAVAGSWKA